jgi:hypothetical protein
MASPESMFSVNEQSSSFGPRSTISADAVDLLRADHQQVATWFDEYERAGDAVRSELAGRICSALSVHQRVEEEIFYPAYVHATGDEATHENNQAQHAAMKQLIAEVSESPSAPDVADALIRRLSSMVGEHVREEERPGGMFAAARESAMDLPALAELIQVRKDQLRAVAAQQTHESCGVVESVETQSEALPRAISEIASDEFDVQG